MTITVTQADIDAGKRQSVGFCPLARALTRALGKPIGVGEDAFEFEQLRYYELPREAIVFRDIFDKGNWAFRKPKALVVGMSAVFVLAGLILVFTVGSGHSVSAAGVVDRVGPKNDAELSVSGPKAIHVGNRSLHKETVVLNFVNHFVHKRVLALRHDVRQALIDPPWFGRDRLDRYSVVVHVANTGIEGQLHVPRRDASTIPDAKCNLGFSSLGVVVDLGSSDGPFDGQPRSLVFPIKREAVFRRLGAGAGGMGADIGGVSAISSGIGGDVVGAPLLGRIKSQNAGNNNQDGVRREHPPFARCLPLILGLLVWWKCLHIDEKRLRNGDLRNWGLSDRFGIPCVWFGLCWLLLAGVRFTWGWWL